MAKAKTATAKPTREALTAKIEALQAQLAETQKQLESLPFPVKKGDKVWIPAVVTEVTPDDKDSPIELKFECSGGRGVSDTNYYWFRLDQLVAEQP